MNTNAFKLSALAAAVALSVAACGGGSSDENFAPDIQDISVSSSAGSAVSGQVSANDVNQDSLSYSASVQANEDGSVPGLISIDSNGQFIYIPLMSGTAVIDISVSDGNKTTSQSVTLEETVGDPLVAQQWHLRNTGQLAYAQSDFLLEKWKEYLTLTAGEEAAAAFEFEEGVSVAGEDMNVMDAHLNGVTGEGSIAIVVDSGLELNHEDLSANIYPGGSLNFVTGTKDITDPFNDYSSLPGDHGTSVAGLIAAKGWNNLGGRGVAPNASLAGFNYLQQQDSMAYMLSHGLPGTAFTKSANVVAFNRSYGSSVPVVYPASVANRSVEKYTVTELRDGLGALNVKSNGNSFQDDQYSSLCALPGRAVELSLTCSDVNFQSSNASPYYTTVAAVNADGTHTSYSTAGAGTFISAPAGEYGQFDPAMVTTDESSCLRGYSGYENYPDSDLGPIADFWAAYAGFDYPGVEEENAGCNYTSHFNGTSSAAPNYTGVTALIAEANPELSWREINYIAASTATQVDPENEPVVLTIGDAEWTAHAGWVENAAGFSFNNLYGFGRVDAGAAVAMAKEGVDLGEWVESEWIPAAIETPVAIPDNSAEGVSQTIAVEDDVTIETMQLKVTIANPEMAYSYMDPDENGMSYASMAGSDIAIEVTSPAGTRNVVIASRNGLVISAQGAPSLGYVMYETELKTNAFYGESAAGEWTVKVLDTAADSFQVQNGGSWFYDGPTTFYNNSQDSTLESLAVRVMGH
jgi:subtilisin family serine protease